MAIIKTFFWVVEIKIWGCELLFTTPKLQFYIGQKTVTRFNSQVKRELWYYLTNTQLDWSLNFSEYS